MQENAELSELLMRLFSTFFIEFTKRKFILVRVDQLSDGRENAFEARCPKHIHKRECIRVSRFTRPDHEIIILIKLRRQDEELGQKQREKITSKFGKYLEEDQKGFLIRIPDILGAFKAYDTVEISNVITQIYYSAIECE